MNGGLQSSTKKLILPKSKQISWWPAGWILKCRSCVGSWCERSRFAGVQWSPGTAPRTGRCCSARRSSPPARWSRSRPRHTSCTRWRGWRWCPPSHPPEHPAQLLLPGPAHRHVHSHHELLQRQFPSDGGYEETGAY